MNPLASPQPEMKDYAIADRLGSGTFATVFRGYRKVCPFYVAGLCSLGHNYACKLNQNLWKQAWMLKIVVS